MQVLVVRHHLEDDPGFVGQAFERRGAVVDVHRFPDDGPLPDPGLFDAAVVLGSKWSVYDRDAVGAWIDEELAWLRRAEQVGLPVLGICFGAQAVATAFGGRVEKAPVPEIGWVEIEPVGAPSIEAGPWLEFHGDRCVLPDGAVELARNAAGVQAFSVGRQLCVQFHPEVDADQLDRWFEHGGRDAASAAGVDPDRLVEETRAQEDAARTRADGLVGVLLAVAPTGAA